MLHDVRYALRALTRAPALTATLVLSLGIGVGANAAVFNFISALLFRPPAGLASARSLAVVHPHQTSGSDLSLMSHVRFAELQHAGGFEAVAAYDDSAITGATIGETSRRVRIAAVTGNLFEVLGMKAATGRLIGPGDTGTAVISDKLWEVYGRPDDITSRVVRIDGVDLPIIGVAAAGFRGLHPGHTTDVWRLLPEPMTAEERTATHLAVIARAPDINKAQAGLAGRFTVLRYRFMDPALAADTALLSAVLTGATLLVLICAAVNAASLLLSRGNARRRDLAVKLALGASRARLARQLLLESALIGAAGGLAGLLFAHWTTTIVPSMFAPEHAEMLEAGLSPAIVFTTLAGAILLGTGLGAMPAMYGTAPITLLDLRGDAGSISETGRGSRVQTALVVSQIAVSTVLLLSALLLNRSLTRALEGDLGPAARNVVVATIAEPPFSFRPAAGQREFAQIIGQAMKLRDVTAAGYIATLPLQRTNRAVFGVETKPGAIDRMETDTNIVSLTYFGAMNSKLVEGRFFDAGDTGLARQVAVINDIAMRRHFGASAIGRRIIDDRGEPIEIVGVIQSGRYRAMQESPAPMVYRPLSQVYVPRMHLVMRTLEEPGPRTYQRMRMSLTAGRMELVRVATLDEHLAESLVLDRFATTLVSACGLMALLLAIAGAYSLMLDSVQRRTREIGLRIALGASALRIGRSIFAFGMTLTAIGVAIGLVTVLALERAARAFLVGLPAVDLATMAMTAGVLAMVVSLAAILPARRALRVSPTVALRHT